MKLRFLSKRMALLASAWPVLLLAPVLTYGQFPGRGGPPRPAKQAAVIDLTGYWVSVVTEDWRFRMVTPPKGDIAGFQPAFGPGLLNAAGQKIVDAWDPEKDTASGNACKGYGAAALMRVPSRFHITWQDDNTMKIEADAGTQTRVLHFAASQPPAASSLQGYSVANWQIALGGRFGRGGQGQPGAAAQNGGSLHVVTDHLSGGYLRKNGIPYSDKTTVTEYYDLVKEPDGEQWLIVKTIVEDPTYLTRSFITSTNLKKQADATGWNPSPCSAW
jgi:hypothetical protein